MIDNLLAGGPSLIHEERAETLAAMATLAGYTVAVNALPDRSRPDVLRTRPSDRAIFLGDAKATETPGNQETRARLRRYLTFMRSYVAAGGFGVVALIVSGRDAYGWLRLLREFCVHVGSDTSHLTRLDAVDDRTAVAWHPLGGRAP